MDGWVGWAQCRTEEDVRTGRKLVGGRTRELSGGGDGCCCWSRAAPCWLLLSKEGVKNGRKLVRDCSEKYCCFGDCRCFFGAQCRLPVMEEDVNTGRKLEGGYGGRVVLLPLHSLRRTTGRPQRRTPSHPHTHPHPHTTALPFQLDEVFVMPRRASRVTKLLLRPPHTTPPPPLLACSWRRTLSSPARSGSRS